MSLEHANHKSAPDATNIRLIIDQANKRLYDDACQKFGKQHVDSGHFNRSDLGEMAAVAILGPGACKTLGHEKSKVAGAAIVSLVAPALLGGIEEGKKQFTQHTMETVNAGSGNALMGAGGGALYAWNPLVATGAAVVGAGFLIDDQLNSARNKERNNELLRVASNLHKLDDRALTNAAIKLKSYLGPDAYNAAFTATTAGMGFKPGHEVGAAIKAEVSIDSLKTVASQMGTMLANALEGLSARPQSVGLRPAFQGVGDCASNSAKSPLSNLFNFAMSKDKWGGLADEDEIAFNKAMDRFRAIKKTATPEQTKMKAFNSGSLIEVIDGVTVQRMPKAEQGNPFKHWINKSWKQLNAEGVAVKIPEISINYKGVYVKNLDIPFNAEGVYVKNSPKYKSTQYLINGETYVFSSPNRLTIESFGTEDIRIDIDKSKVGAAACKKLLNNLLYHEDHPLPFIDEVRSTLGLD